MTQLDVGDEAQQKKRALDPAKLAEGAIEQIFAVGRNTDQVIPSPVNATAGIGRSLTVSRNTSGRA